ncbi:unnamed protein product [Schistocephalus solidus]|uniref:Actin-related protein 10 n=1 Tax=Schistocephalus solidus TaxID=70667 RepID=A0A183T7S8_SCHSO|nr:unnamed protein product [Schistocephalus solidus]
MAPRTAQKLVSSHFFGNEALDKCSLLQLIRPVSEAEIVNWDAIEHLLYCVYSKYLKILPCTLPLLISESIFPSINSRRRLLEMAFESLAVPALYAINSAPLALFSTRRTSGVVLDSGEAFTAIVPIRDGQPLRDATFLSTLAGNFLTQRLRDMLATKGYYPQSIAELEALHDIKQRMCHVSADFYTESITFSPRACSKIYELPDGQTVPLGEELFGCPEELFGQTLTAACPQFAAGLPNILIAAIDKCAPDCRSLMSENVVLAGGSTLFPGFVERLGREVRRRSPRGRPINIYAPEDRLNTAWRGGSALATFANFQKFWLTPEEYREQGFSRLDKYFH